MFQQVGLPSDGINGGCIEQKNRNDACLVNCFFCELMVYVTLVFWLQVDLILDTQSIIAMSPSPYIP